MSKSGKVPPKAAKVLGLGNVAPKAAKVLGMGMTGAGKAVTKGVSKAKAPTTGFTGAKVTSTKEMKPSSPVIGARGTGVTGNVIEKGRMKDRVKKAGLGGL